MHYLLLHPFCINVADLQYRAYHVPIRRASFQNFDAPDLYFVMTLLFSREEKALFST